MSTPFEVCANTAGNMEPGDEYSGYELWRNAVKPYNYLPGWIMWRTFSENYQGLRVELADYHLSIKDNHNEVIFESKEGFDVQDALFCDINDDGEDELLVLFWKKGRYGISTPFWVTEDPEKDIYSQHIFIYRKDMDCGYKSIWGASDITLDALRWKYDEAHKVLLIEDRFGEVTGWRYPEWGLTKTDISATVYAAGDNLMHTAVYSYGLRKGNTDYDYLYAGIKNRLKEADLTVINHETILVEDPGSYSDFPRFGTPVGVGEAIAKAGFDVVTAATNHALDKGQTALEFTKNFYKEKNILCLGIQTQDEKEYIPYETINRNGIKLALLNYTFATNGMQADYPYEIHTLDDENRIRKDIRLAKADSEAVIVFVHWGTEYSNKPDEDQIKWAGIFADEGVDVVVGTHPHVLQPVEVIEGKDEHQTLIYYSLGNYISAQSDEACKTGGLAKFDISLTMDEGVKVTAYDLEKIYTIYNDSKYGVSLNQE